MRVWIDLANSPHVPFLRALTDRFVTAGHEVEITARVFAETVPLAHASGFTPLVIGKHGGRQIVGKSSSLIKRAWDLAKWVRKRRIDLAVGHNSYSQILAARALRIKTVTLMDYEHQPANHLAFRLASRIIVPASFPAMELRRFGAPVGRVRRYHGTKEDVYLADFQPDPAFTARLCELGVSPDNVLVLMRPPAVEALYHRFDNPLFDEALERLSTDENVRIVLLPRNEAQREMYSGRERVIVPPQPLPGPDLIAVSDLVISAGGTINREAAALGVPVASIYAGKWAAVDEQLVNEGRLLRISSSTDLQGLEIKKRGPASPRRSHAVIEEIINFIFE